MKTVNNNIIIYEDLSTYWGKIFFAIITFILSAILLTWSVMIYVEDDMSFKAPLPIIGLFLCGLFCAFAFYQTIKLILSVDKEKPIFTLNATGLQYAHDTLKHWQDIDHIELYIIFDSAEMALHLTNAEIIKYPLVNMYDVSEFKDLKKLQALLQRFTDKVSITN